jgi:hypothetical protein
MKRFLLRLVVAVDILFVGSISEAQEEPPFQIPLDTYPAIPHNLGMKFFAASWEPGGSMGGGTMVISEDVLTYMGSGDVVPYRVLYEGQNYVLTVTLNRYATTWSSFDVFALNPWFKGDTDPYGYALMQWYCSDPSMKGGDHAFSWPREKLIETFTSRCGKEFGADYIAWKWFRGDWSVLIYSRTRP